MRHHPLTPMTDANLVRVLQAQLNPAKGRRVGLVDFKTVAQSADVILNRMDELKTEGIAIAIVDALSDDDLGRLSEALRNSPLLTAGSGLGSSLPRNWGFRPGEPVLLPPAHGRKAILSGSCSTATNAQVQHFIHHGGQAYALRPKLPIAEVLEWADSHWRQNTEQPLLVHSTTEPARVNTADAPMIEQTMAALARAFVQRGVGMLVVAGGETAGICVQALGITQLQIGPQIDPGVPWCYAGDCTSP